MIWTIIAVLVILLDQITKKIVEYKMEIRETIELIPGVFQFTHYKNDGASWGMLSGGRWAFVVLTFLIIGAVLFWIYKKKPTNKVLLFGISLVLGGAVGNLIDRILYGQVTDFLDFCLINFPIFNVADIAITVGTVFVAIYLFFYMEDGEGGVNDGK